MAEDRAPSRRFGPDRRLAGLAAAGALVALLLAVFDGDAGGRVLAIPAAVLLAAFAVVDTLYWPRLTASAAGLQVHSPFSSAALGWAEIDAIRVDERSRLGLSSRALEIDAGARLILLGRRVLGADPREVLPLVLAFAPH